MLALYTRSSCPRLGKAAESQPPGGRQRDVLAALRSEPFWMVDGKPEVIGSSVGLYRERVSND